MDISRLLLLSIIFLFCIAGCDIAPENTGLTSSNGLVNKGVMSNAEVNAYKAGSLEFIKRTYTNSDGTFVFEDMNYQGVVYVEVTTTSQTLSTCDSASGCGSFSGGLKLPGEFDANLDGTVDFGDIHYYNDSNFKLTSFINPDFGDLENFGEFAVTPLTHLAAQRIISEGVGSAEGVDIVNAQVAELFGLDGVDITRLVPPDVTNAEKMLNASDAERMYSTLNAAVASSVTNDKDLVAVIDELTTSFVDDGGLIGNSADSDNTTLASLHALADDVAATVESELAINMDTVQQAIQEQETENLSSTPDSLIEPTTSFDDSDGDGLTNEQEASLGTDPLIADTDIDGLSDGQEVNNYSTDPLLADSDSDGISDFDELMVIGTDPNVADSGLDNDNDGLTNLQEVANGTSAVLADTDNDGLTDGQEVNAYSTNPLSADGDSDGLTDIEELMVYNSDPNVADSTLDNDQDGLSNLEEKNAGTDANLFDSDNDGIPDGWEVQNGLNPLFSSDAQISSDSDGLLNIDEYFAGTDPFNADTDNDTVPDDEDSADGDDIPDGVEVIEGLALGQDDGVVDFDGDTISNEVEHNNGSNVHSPTPILELASDAEIFESIDDLDGARFTLDEERFITSYYDTSDRTFTDAITDNNQQEDLLIYDFNSDRYTLPLRQYGGSSLITDHNVKAMDTTADGKRSLVMSSSNQIVNADSNEMFDLFVYDHFANKVKRLASPAQFDYGSFLGSLSADGSKVAFTTMTAIGGTLDGDATNDVYLINMVTNDIKLVSGNDAGDGSATGQSGVPKLSADASRLIYLSNADDLNLDSGTQGSTGTDDLYAYDIASGKTIRVSTVVAAIDNVGSILLPQISSDGSSAIFYTQRDVLQKGNQPSGFQLYYVDLDSCFSASSCTFSHITNAQGSTDYSDSGAMYDYEVFARLSADGEYVLHKSDANNLNTLDVVPDGKDIFLWGKQTKTNQLVTQYVYDNTKTVYESDPTQRPEAMYFLNLGISGVSTTPDFKNVYTMLTGGYQILDITYNENCGEVGCLHRIALNLPQQDSDGDGLNDRQELALTTGLNNSDTDGDGLSDGEEIYTYKTSPIHSDSDEDGWEDLFEINQQTSPTSFNDADGDGLSDADEALQGTLINVADSDSDGLTDGQEVSITNTNPNVANTDGDAVLLDGDEDADSDGLSNAQEITSYHTDWESSDTDGEGLTDSDEVNIHSTDPLKTDTDGGGIDDYYEVNVDGTDPLNPADDGGA